MKRKIYLILGCIFAATFVVSTAMVCLTLYRYRQADVLYGDMQYRYVTTVSQGEKPPSESAAPSEPAQSPGDSPQQDPIEPVIAPIRVDFDALLQENSDVVGWLYCEDTPINYPIARSGDNDYYLHRDLSGSYLYSGTLFVDYRCAAVGVAQNHIIYGHNMKNDTMFGTLSEYKEQSYYDAHPVLWYLTPDGGYRIDLFAGMVTASDSEVYTPSFSGEETFSAFLQNILESSTFVSDIPVSEEDAIVTLSTCSYEFGNARYVVFGKLTALTA